MKEEDKVKEEIKEQLFKNIQNEIDKFKCVVNPFDVIYILSIILCYITSDNIKAGGTARNATIDLINDIYDTLESMVKNKD